MATHTTNVSDSLVWHITRSNNAYLVKRASGGSPQFSSDPLNLVNKNSRKYAGFANNKAIGVQSAKDGDIVVMAKKPGAENRPSSIINTPTTASNRKVYAGLAKATVGYRSDLREEAVARASAILASQRPKKPSPEKKVRGAKARKVAE